MTAFPSGYIETTDRLTLEQQFRLVEIAHKTNDVEIRHCAIMILQCYLHPPLIFGRDERLKDPAP